MYVPNHQTFDFAKKFQWAPERLRPGFNDEMITLTLSQVIPGFYMSAVQVFWKHCGKRRNCSKRAISLFLSVFWRVFCHFYQTWNYILQTLSVWKSPKLVVWERVKHCDYMNCLVWCQSIWAVKFYIFPSVSDSSPAENTNNTITTMRECWQEVKTKHTRNAMHQIRFDNQLLTDSHVTFCLLTESFNRSNNAQT